MTWWQEQRPERKYPLCPNCRTGIMGPGLEEAGQYTHLKCPECNRVFDRVALKEVVNKDEKTQVEPEGPGNIHAGRTNPYAHAPKGIPKPPQRQGTPGNPRVIP